MTDIIALNRKRGGIKNQLRKLNNVLTEGQCKMDIPELQAHLDSVLNLKLKYDSLSEVDEDLQKIEFAHFAFFAFSCATDVIRHSRPDSTLLRIRDVVFAGIVFPFGLFVPIMFWGIYAINREMIFPEVLDGFYPAWLNHISHTILLPVVLLEAVIVNHRYPSRRGGFACMLAYGVAYTLWIFYLAVAKDIWVYTIFKYMTWYIKIAFFAGCFVLALFLYIVCEKINYYFWDARRKIRLSASSM